MSATQQLRKPSEPSQAAHAGGPFYEVLTAEELARRWKVPTSWVREHCRSRSADPIPHAQLGRYVRFSFGSPALTARWERRLMGAK
jgi:hypothetical protein